VIAASYPGEELETEAAPLREILRRPGVATALLGAVASFAVMVGVMNLSGYVAVGHGHHQSDVFTIISAHIVGMYGLVLVVGDLVERIGLRRSIVLGLAIMTVSNAALASLDGIAGMSACLFGLGLGWNLSFVAATTELIRLTRPSERGRLIGFADLLSSLVGAALALAGGVLYSDAGIVALAMVAAALSIGPAVWIAARTPRAAVAAAR
jgi:predicted MFS family arabinose efflux permease